LRLPFAALCASLEKRFSILTTKLLCYLIKNHLSKEAQSAANGKRKNSNLSIFKIKLEY
jgi:hypothetical protein